jgi:site-specific DNA-cytosine methylase
MNVKSNYPLVLDAVQKAERGPWGIGDALVKEIAVSGANTIRQKIVGGSDGLGPLFEACSRYLKSKGYEYTIGHLRDLRTTSDRFPRSTRVEGVSWTAHDRAGTPENLKQVLTTLRKMHLPTLQENVEMVMAEWRRKDEEVRERKGAEAEKKRQAAKEDKKAARERARKAKSDAEKRKAERDAEEAERREAEARREAAESAKAPRGKDITTEMPDQDELSVKASLMKISADAQSIAKTLKQNLKMLDSMDELDADFAESIIEHHTEIVALAKQIADRFRNRKSRFQVHQGGAA